MDLKYYTASVFKIIIAAVGFVSTFYTAINLTLFLSDPNSLQDQLHKKDDWISASWCLFINMSLLSLFMLQHSLMALPELKNVFISYNLNELQRSIYVIATTFTLQVLMKNWHIIPGLTVWEYKNISGPIWWSYIFTHVIAWTLIYVGTICMDVNELLGIKQVYYSIKNLPDPFSQKSQQLQKLYSHMRHPGFIAFLLIFWVTPIMRLDRLLVAVIFTLYMYICWKTDGNDYRYQELQYIRKFHELNYLH